MKFIVFLSVLCLSAAAVSAAGGVKTNRTLIEPKEKIEIISNMQLDNEGILEEEGVCACSADDDCDNIEGGICVCEARTASIEIYDFLSGCLLDYSRGINFNDECGTGMPDNTRRIRGLTRSDKIPKGNRRIKKSRRLKGSKGSKGKGYNYVEDGTDDKGCGRRRLESCAVEDSGTCWYPKLEVSSSSLTAQIEPTEYPKEEPTKTTATETIIQSAKKAAATSGPTKAPETPEPTAFPTSSPTSSPTVGPSDVPTANPTEAHSDGPSASPTSSPTMGPTSSPTSSPTAQHSQEPSTSPTEIPTKEHTSMPTDDPSVSPSISISVIPSSQPNSLPSTSPSNSLTLSPTGGPTVPPTDEPSAYPTAMPVVPTHSPADIVSRSSPYDCSDVALDVQCNAVLNDGGEMDCKSLQGNLFDDTQLVVTWTYTATNNCPFERVLARQSKTKCSLCIPQGFQCTKDAYIFDPEAGEKYYILEPYETVVTTETQNIEGDRVIPCIYTRDLNVRIRTTNRASSGSIGKETSYTFVSPKMK